MVLAVDSISATALDGNDWSNGGEGGEEETTSHEEGEIENDDIQCWPIFYAIMVFKP